jgi:hypothetical protein
MITAIEQHCPIGPEQAGANFRRRHQPGQNLRGGLHFHPGCFRTDGGSLRQRPGNDFAFHDEFGDARFNEALPELIEIKHAAHQNGQRQRVDRHDAA